MNIVKNTALTTVVLAGAATALLGFAGNANAVGYPTDLPPGWFQAQGGANSQGVGFCLNQVARDPQGIDGVPSLGAAVSSIAAQGPGAVAGKIDETRYPLCGGPGAGE